MSLSLMSSSLLIRRALLGNGMFSLSSGLVSLVWADPLAGTPSTPAPLVLRALRLGLLEYAGFLFWLARPPTPSRPLAWLSSFLDDGWVVGSGVLLLLPAIPLTGAGRWTIGGVALLVAIFGLLQMIGLTRFQTKEA